VIWLDVLMVAAVGYFAVSGFRSFRRACDLPDEAAAEQLRRAGRTSLAIGGAVLVFAVLF